MLTHLAAGLIGAMFGLFFGLLWAGCAILEKRTAELEDQHARELEGMRPECLVRDAESKP